MNTVINVRIPEESVKEINRLVKKKKFLNKSDCIRYAVKRYLERVRK
jgi:Arc/MetJ-type ribon-helix-helix transcriptional regulator